MAAGNIRSAALGRPRMRRRSGRLARRVGAELSSFQLETTQSLAADAATVLNVSEDHLDRHGSTRRTRKPRRASSPAPCGAQSRRRALMSMRRPSCRATKRDPAARGPHLRHRCAGDDADFGLVRGAARASPAGEGVAEHEGEDGDAAPRRLMPQEVLRIWRRHNAANALAALALNRAIGLPLAPMRRRTTTTTRPAASRAETVADLRGVRYVDDSKGTNVGATLAALAGLGAGWRRRAWC